jgi:hypothetical protein
MGKREQPDDLDTLRRCWRRWTAVVELFAKHRRGRRRVDPGAYAALHGELLAACRSLAGRTEGELAAFYRELEALAQPWLSPEVLARADGRLLADLLRRCRKKAHGLGGSGPARWFRAPAVRLPGASAFVWLAVAAGVVLFFWKGGRVWRRAWYAADDVWAPVWFFLKGISFPQWLAAGGVVVTLLSIYAASRTARS